MEMFVIHFEKDKMTLRVPASKADAVGLRSLSSPDTVGKAMSTLRGRARVKRAMWSRRAQEYEQKINSGKILTVPFTQSKCGIEYSLKLITRWSFFQ